MDMDIAIAIEGEDGLFRGDANNTSPAESRFSQAKRFEVK